MKSNILRALAGALVPGAVLILSVTGCKEPVDPKAEIEAGILYREVTRTVPGLSIVYKTAETVWVGYEFNGSQDPATAPLVVDYPYGDSSSWELRTMNGKTYYARIVNKSAAPAATALVFEEKYRIAQGLTEATISTTSEDTTYTAPYVVAVEETVTLDYATRSIQIKESDFLTNAPAGKTPVNGGWLVKRTVPALVIIPGSATENSVLVGYEVPADQDPETAITESTWKVNSSSSTGTTYYDKGRLDDDNDDKTYRAVQVTASGSVVYATFASEYTLSAAGTTSGTANTTVTLAVPKTAFATTASTIRAVTSGDVKVYSGPVKVQNGSTWTDLSAEQRRIDVALPLDNSAVQYVKYRYKYAGDTGWAYPSNVSDIITDRFAYQNGTTDNNHLGLKTAQVSFNAAAVRYKLTATADIKTDYSNVSYDGSTIGTFQVRSNEYPSQQYADGYVTVGGNINTKPVWQRYDNKYVDLRGTEYEAAAVTVGRTSIGYAVPITIIGSGVNAYVPVEVDTSYYEFPTTVELKYATDNNSHTLETSSTGADGYSVTLSAYEAPVPSTPGFSIAGN
ncbi:MAG: hypothetical protein LBR16_09080 [Treponema sp.]|jgi:hypothetical protein|nr:hypothetical protein [Treponema sp.]